MAPPQHKPVHTGVACPDCKEDTPVFAIMGRGLCCRNGHKFDDQDHLLSRKPKKIPIPTSITRQDGYQEVRLSIPQDVVQQLQSRFGDKLQSVLSGVLFSMSNPNSLMVAGEDVLRIGKELGENIKDGSHLYGLIYAMNEQRKDFRDKAEKVVSATSEVRVSDGDTISVQITIPGLLEKMMDRAKFRGITVSRFVEETISSGIDAGWA